MHVPNHQVPMAPPYMAQPSAGGIPEPPDAAALATERCLARSEQSAEYVVDPRRLAPMSDPVDEIETRLILELRHEEYAARRALEEIFENGEAECLSM